MSKMSCTSGVADLMLHLQQLLRHWKPLLQLRRRILHAKPHFSKSMMSQCLSFMLVQSYST